VSFPIRTLNGSDTLQRVADVVHDIEEFGDLPQYLLDRLSQILSKKRVITSRTIDLFLKPDVDRIAIYDCGSKYLIPLC
jgi:DNA repair protein RAD7